MTTVEVLFPDKVRVPRPSKGFIRRQRLIEQIHGAVGKRLIFIAAGAGFGKSSLLADFASDAAFPVCWYKIDGADQDLGTFVNFLVASLGQQFPAFEIETGSVTGSSPSTLAARLTAEIRQQINAFFVLILDDFHAVDASEEINQFIDAFLEYLGDQASVIIASRTLPQGLRLSRLAAAGQAVGLGHQELAFRAPEIFEFFSATLGIEISLEEAEQFQEFSRGWIAAIALSRGRWPERLLNQAAVLGNSTSNLFDYVSEEVLSQLDDEAIQFLMSSATLPRVVASWCDQLFGRDDSSQILERISNQILFIAKRDGPPLYYECHALFRDYLLDRLRRESPSLFLDLHRRAAALVAQEGFPEDAVELSITGGAIEDALSYLEAEGERFQLAGKWYLLRDWFTRPPIEAALEKRPYLLLQKARVEERTGNADLAILDCGKARAMFRKLEDRDGESRALVAHARTLIRKGQFLVADDIAHEALEILPAADPTTEAQVREVIGLCARHAGDLDGACKHLTAALKRAQEADDLFLQGSLERNLASVLMTKDVLVEAHQHYRAARAIWTRLHDTALESAAINGMGIVQRRWGNHAESYALFQEALDKVRAFGTHPQFEGLILVNLAENELDTGNYPGCEQHCREALDIARRIDDKWLLGWTLFIQSEARRLSGDILGAESAVQECSRWAEQSGAVQTRAYAFLSLASLAALRHEWEEAECAFQQSLSLFSEIGAPRDLAKSQLRHGLFRIGQGDSSAVIDAINSACHILEEIGQPTAATIEISQQPAGLLDRLEAIPGLPVVVRRAVSRARLWTVEHKAEVHVAPVVRQESSTPKRLEIKVKGFGTPRVEVDGREIAATEWGSVTARDLFYFLLQHPDGLRKEQVTAKLWPDLSPARGSSQFHSNLYRLRRALGQEVVVVHRGKYHFGNGVDIRSEVKIFESQMERALRSLLNSDLDAKNLEGALELYCGPFLEDSYAEWADECRTRLRNLYLQGTLVLASYFESKGLLHRSLSLAQKALAADYSLDSVHLRLIRLWIQMEEPGLAAEHFEEYAGWYKQELEDVPPPELRAAYSQALQMIQRA